MFNKQGMIIMKRGKNKSAKKLTSLVLTAGLMTMSFFNSGTVYAENVFTGEIPINGPSPSYTDPAQDEKGTYPQQNDGNVNEDITVINPDTGVTSPSLEGGEEISSNRTLEYDSGWVTKYIQETGEQGKSEINLRVEGREFGKKVDIVLVVDNSNSMSMTDGTNTSRVLATKGAANQFINAFKNNDRVGIALVTYGSNILDGNLLKFGTNTPFVNMYASGNGYTYSNEFINDDTDETSGVMNYYADSIREVRFQNDFVLGETDQNFCSGFTYTNRDKAILAGKVPGDVPSDRRKNSGGTFTQKALMEAQEMIKWKTRTDEAAGLEESEKIIVLLTDGAPTHSYRVKAVAQAPGAIVRYFPEKEEYSSAFSDSEPYGGNIAAEFAIPSDARVAEWTYDDVIDNIRGNGTKLHLAGRELGPRGTTESIGTKLHWDSRNGYNFKETERTTSIFNHHGRYGAYSYPGRGNNLDYTVNYGTAENPNIVRYSHILDKEYTTEAGDFTIKDNAFATISQAVKIRNEGTDIYTIGVGMRDSYVTAMDKLEITDPFEYGSLNYTLKVPSLKDLGDSVSEEELKNIMINISGDESRYLDAEGAGDIVDQFNRVAYEIKKSIPHGKVEDPIGEYFNLDIENPENLTVKYPWTSMTEPEYYDYDIEITMDSGTEQAQENLYHSLIEKGYSEEEARERLVKVIYNEETETLYIDNITLIGTGEWVNMKYNVRADTELKNEAGEEIYQPNVLYPANKRTTLVPDTRSSKKKYLDFYVPSARVNSVNIEAVKEWLGFSEESKFDIEFDLKRNGEFFNKEEEPYIIMENPDTGEWRTKIENLIKFDSMGNDYEFEVIERTDETANYTVRVDDETNEILNPGIKKFKIRNILPNMPNTGGKGTKMYKTVGMPLVLGTALIMMRKKWKY